MRRRLEICAAILAVAGLACAFGTGPAGAQPQPAPAAQASPAAPVAGAQAPYAVQYQKHVVIRPDLTTTEVLTRRIKLLVPSAIQALSQEQLPFIDGMQTLEVLEAYTEKSDGRRIPVDPASIITQDPASGLQLTYLRDLKQRVIIFPDVAVGDTLVATVKLEQTKNLFPGQLTHFDLFPRSLPYTSAQVTIEAPAGLDLQIKTIGSGLTDSVEMSGDIRRHTITLTPQGYRPQEQGATSALDRESAILLSTFKSYAELGMTFGDTALPKAAVTPEIAALANEITANITDRKAQAVAIDAWMKKNIRYVAIYLSLGRVVPHDADTVLANKFGDCKDKATLMSALLAAKGIASEAVLINATNDYTLPEPPTLAALNHVILYLPEFGIYDDPTVSWAAFGILAPETYDKPVVHVSQAGARLSRTPPMQSQDHVAHAVTTLNIAADGTVTGQTRESNTGFLATALRVAGGAVQVLGEATASARQLQGFNTPGSGRFDLGNIGAAMDPVVITGSFTLNDRFKAPPPGGRTVIPYGMPLTARPGNFLLGARFSGRRSPFVCYAGTQIEDIDAKFAPGLPLPVPLRPTSIDNPYFSYRSTYRLEDRALKIHREFISRVAAQVCPAEVEAQIAADMETVRIDVYSGYAFNAPPPPAAPPGTPQEVKRTMTVDRKAQIDYVASLNPDCSSLGFATVHLVEEPQHGSVAIDHGTGYANYPQNNPRSECNKRQTEGMVISYAPNAGFTGADSVMVEVITPAGTSFKRRYAISVNPPAPPQTFEFTRIAAADQVLQLAFLFYLNPDCSPIGFATVHVLEEPRHGKATVQRGTGFSTFVQNNPRFECNKRRTDGVNLSYAPEEGFTGTDSVTVEVVGPDGSAHKRHFAIEVK
jgi:hypothetical protein